MKITGEAADEAILREMGGRLSRLRLERNLTQAQLAEQAGVSKRTLERLESGSVATQVSGLLRVCRVLGVAERFDRLVPEAIASPIEQLKLQGRRRQRASTKKAATGSSKKWRWDNEP